MFGVLCAFLVAPAFYNKYKNEPGVKRAVHLSHSFARDGHYYDTSNGYVVENMDAKVKEYRKSKGWE